MEYRNWKRDLAKVTFGDVSEMVLNGSICVHAQYKNLLLILVLY